MQEDRILLLLIQMLVVLASARLLGEIFRRFKQPPLAGEIMAGILLGQTVLGQLSPQLFERLFPDDELQHAMFGVTAEIGILFLLLVVGLEVNIVSAWKMRKMTLTVAVTGVVVPLALGTGAAWLLFDQWSETDAPRLAFALLVGAGVAITAITVVARLLFDLKIIKSDLGLFLVSAMALNELLGWAVLAVVLGLVGTGVAGDGVDAVALVGTMIGIFAFAAFSLTGGRLLVTRALMWIAARKSIPSPAAPLSLVVCLGLFAGAVTGALGVHPVFGFLLAGIMAGDPRALSEHTRSIIAQMVESIFVPLFFAGICLNVDFASQFDLLTVTLVTALSIGGKFLGAWLGTLMVTMPKPDRIPIAIAHIPGGPMGVLLASVAKDAGVIGPEMFVALVVASILSALMVGPLFTWRLQHEEKHPVEGFFSRENVLFGMQVRTRDEAIARLAEKAAQGDGMPSAEVIREAVSDREKTMGTGVGHGIAIPHARIPDLERAMVVLGVAEEGIDWDAIDGKPARLVFLVLTAVDENDTQLEILATIAGAFTGEGTVEQLVEAEDADAVWRELSARLESMAAEPLVTIEFGS